MIDMVVAFVFVFFKLMLCFLCCYRFSVNKDLYKSTVRLERYDRDSGVVYYAVYF